MFTVARIPISYLVVTIALISTSILQAKEPKKVFPTAPPPAQIADAKKIFVSNAGVEMPGYWFDGPSDRLYNQFYAAVKEWGHYELVSTPAQADLVFEICATSVVTSFVTDTIPAPHLKLVILDPKTRIVLWTFIEPAKQSEKSFNEAMDKLMADLKQLLSPTPMQSP